MAKTTLPADQDAGGDSRLQLERVSCAVCFKEVPLSEAAVPEAVDYMMYFCGLDCLESWRKQSTDA